MKGRGEIITILCMSVFLICILYAMTYGGIVKAEELEKQPEKVGEKTEVDIEEELRWAEEVKKILKDIGVVIMSTYEELMVILTTASLIVLILNYTHKK